MENLVTKWVNSRDRQGCTELHRVVQNNHKNVVTHITSLIKSKADIHAKDNNGNTPLDLAIKSGSSEVVQALCALSSFDPITANLTGNATLEHEGTYSFFPDATKDK